MNFSNLSQLLRQWRIFLIGAYFLAIPFSYSFQPLAALMALFGLRDIVLRKINLRQPIFIYLLVLFLLYWTPMLLSLLTAAHQAEVVEKALLALRFPLMAVFIIRTMQTQWNWGNLNVFIVFVVSLWLVDAISQLLFSVSLFNSEYNGLITGPFDKNSLTLWLVLLMLPFFSSLKEVFGVKLSSLLSPFFIIAYLAVFLFSNDVQGYLAACSWVLIALFTIVKHGSYRILPIFLGLVICILGQFYLNHAFTPAKISYAWKGNLSNALDWHGYENLDGKYEKNAQRSLTGVGVGGMDSQFAEYINAELPKREQNTLLNRPMQWVEARLETGWIGMYCYLLMTAVMLILLFKSRQPFYWVFASLIALFPMLSHTALFGSYWSTAIWIFIALALAKHHQLSLLNKSD